MTFEERMAELGVDPDIVSLHEDRCDALYERFFKAAEAIAQELGIGFSALTMITILLREIAERDDIIDRMETRLVNLTGERDYLAKRVYDESINCSACTYDAGTYCDNEQAECSFEFAGVPEDWRSNDD